MGNWKQKVSDPDWRSKLGRKMIWQGLGGLAILETLQYFLK